MVRIHCTIEVLEMIYMCNKNMCPEMEQRGVTSHAQWSIGEYRRAKWNVDSMLEVWSKASIRRRRNVESNFCFVCLDSMKRSSASGRRFGRLLRRRLAKQKRITSEYLLRHNEVKMRTIHTGISIDSAELGFQELEAG